MIILIHVITVKNEIAFLKNKFSSIHTFNTFTKLGYIVLNYSILLWIILMALGGDRSSIWNDSLVPYFLRVFWSFPSLGEKIAIVITMTNAKQHTTINGTVPQKDWSESKLFIIYRKQIWYTCNSCAQDHFVLLCCLEILELFK